MDEFAPQNDRLRRLGLWVSMTGILVGILVCFNSVEPKSHLFTNRYHKLLPAFITRTVSVAEPIIIIGFKSFDSDEMDWEGIPPTASSRVPAVAAERQPKSQSSKATVEKIPTVSGKKAEHMLRPTIFRIAHRHRIDPAMVQAIIMAESSFNPNAVFKRGAIGLMQLMPNTAKSLGIEDPLNPEHNITGGVLYFKKLLKEFHGDVTLALAAYNAGTSKVKEYQGVPPFKSTQVYIEKVLEYYQRYKSVPTHKDDRA
jgi:hypothetical protein